jgi:hypothetical protein
MKSSRVLVAGESRICPHCKETILKSSVSCPICNHVLRFGSITKDFDSHPTTCLLLVEGTVHHPANGETLEYSLIVEVRDGTGKLVSRQNVGVGALRRSETRTFSLRVEAARAARHAM